MFRPAIVFALLAAGPAVAANLVPNPGFEQVTSCPTGFSHLFKAALLVRRISLGQRPGEHVRQPGRARRGPRAQFPVPAMKTTWGQLKGSYR
jgi:hypothetical protein